MDAKKFDKGKPPLGLLPRRALVEVAQVMAFGADKYGKHNWRKGMAWTRLSDAALRHVYAWIDGEDNDTETGYNHLAHAACCLLFLLEYQLALRVGRDDRWKSGSTGAGLVARGVLDSDEGAPRTRA